MASSLESTLSIGGLASLIPQQIIKETSDLPKTAPQSLSPHPDSNQILFSMPCLTGSVVWNPGSEQTGSTKSVEIGRQLEGGMMTGKEVITDNLT